MQNTPVYVFIHLCIDNGNRLKMRRMLHIWIKWKARPFRWTYGASAYSHSSRCVHSSLKGKVERGWTEHASGAIQNMSLKRGPYHRVSSVPWLKEKKRTVRMSAHKWQNSMQYPDVCILADLTSIAFIPLVSKTTNHFHVRTIEHEVLSSTRNNTAQFSVGWIEFVTFFVYYNWWIGHNQNGIAHNKIVFFSRQTSPHQKQQRRDELHNPTHTYTFIFVWNWTK